MKLEPTVFVVDDDSAIRDSLCWLIQSVGINAEAYACARDLLDNGDLGRPGCLVVDVRMPGTSGLELQRTLVRQGIAMPVIIITAYGDVAMAVRAMKAGALDFIEKPFDHRALLERIQQAVAGDIERAKRQAERSRVVESLAQLTRRERQVLDLLIAGKSTRLIAKDLQLSCRTAEIYRSRLMEKLQAVSLYDLVRKAILSGVYSANTGRL